MLSSILNSERAIQANIQIIRTFIKLKEILISHKGLEFKILKLERKFAEHDEKFMMVFEAIRQLMKEEEKPKAPIGFHP